MLRLNKLMDKLIHICQFEFIQGRNIIDGIIALHEILHDTKIKKKRWDSFEIGL